MKTSTYRPGGRTTVTHREPIAGERQVAPVGTVEAPAASGPQDRSALIADVARFLQRRPRRPDSLRHALTIDPERGRIVVPER